LMNPGAGSRDKSKKLAEPGRRRACARLSGGVFENGLEPREARRRDWQCQRSLEGKI
jgi:hypothetical protein